MMMEILLLLFILLKITFYSLELLYLLNSVYFSEHRLREMKIQVQGSSPVTSDLVAHAGF